MAKRFIGFATAAALVIVSCASSAKTPQAEVEIVRESRDVFNRSFDEQYLSGHWVTRPSRGTIPVVGISGRHRNRDEAIHAAVADAARKVALYHGLYAESAAVLNQGASYLDYFADFDYRLKIHNDPSAYTDSLIFDKDEDVYEKNGSLYVRARYTGVADVPEYATIIEDGVPEWVKNYRADIPGFLTGVGLSRNKGSPQATSQASYENAIVSLLPELGTKVVSTVDDGIGGNVQQNFTTSQGNLTNVMILETWFDSKTGSAWTLLVAKERPLEERR
jgi:hypothetical protein